MSFWLQNRSKKRGQDNYSLRPIIFSVFRFEFPELNNPEKMSSKVVSNLLYYQVGRDLTGPDDESFISRQTTSSQSLSCSFLSSSLFPGRCCTSLSSSPSVVLGLTGINHAWYFISSSVFGAQYYMSLHHVHVKVWKKNHPTAVMFATFVIGSFLIYQVSSISQSREDNMIRGTESILILSVLGSHPNTIKTQRKI